MEGGKNHRQALGKAGEDIACNYLIARGHTILERNWRYGHLEIDIISCDPEGIHFVEVKTRQLNIQAPPQDNVDRLKQRRTASAAKRFLHTAKGLPYGNCECMFDVIAVTYERGSVKTEWFPQAYIPIYL